MGLGELSECTSHLVEYAANRGFSRIPRMTRIMGLVMVVGGNCLKQDFCDLLIYGIVEGMGSYLKRDLWDLEDLWDWESGIGVPSYRRAVSGRLRHAGRAYCF